MFMMTEKDKKKRQREGSFTLIETVIALMLIATLIIEVASVQGNSIVFADYSKNVTKATWLARRVMSQVEYHWNEKPFKELETQTTDGKFEEEPDFTYSIDIQEWKFPFKEMLATVLGGGSVGSTEDGESEKEADSGIEKMVESVVSQIFGDEPIFMTAHVKVFWSEGAQRNESSLTYLLTNQRKLDEAILGLKPQWDALTKPPTTKPNPNQPNKPNSPGENLDQDTPADQEG